MSVVGAVSDGKWQPGPAQAGAADHRHRGGEQPAGATGRAAGGLARRGKYAGKRDTRLTRYSHVGGIAASATTVRWKFADLSTCADSTR
jgi:hypothetical protein